MRRHIFTLATAVLLMGAPCAHADDGVAAPPEKDPARVAHNATSTPIPLDRLVVTATRTEQTAAKAPASVVAIDEESINQRQATTLGELLEDVPNVEFSDPTNPFIQKPSLRGLGPDQTIVTIDGARQNYSSKSGIGSSPTQIDPDMLKSVEVLRGPSSALHGSGGMGGVIAMTTKDASDLLEPGENFGARLKAGYQSASDQLMQSLAVYARDDTFDILAQGTYRDFGDVETTNTSPSRSTIQRDGHSKGGLVKLTARPTDEQRISLGYNYSEGRFASTDSVSTFRQDEHRVVGTYALRPEDTPWLDLKATLQTGWRENGYLNDVPRDLEDTFTSYGGTVQNTSRFGFGDVMRNALTYGVDYYIDHQEGTDAGEPDPARPDATGKDLGLFIQNEMGLFDFLTITPALRYTSYSRASDSDLAEDQQEGEVTPKLTVQAAVCPWLDVFGSYAHSYRPPSLDEIYYAMDYPMPWGAMRVLPNPDLRPETARTWETGFNLSFDGVFTANDPLRVKGVYFYEDIEDLIEAQMTKGPTVPPFNEIHYQSINIGKVHRFGYEMQADYTYDRLMLSAAYGKAIGRDKETGHRAGGSPDKVALRAAYLFPQWDLTVFWKSRFVAAHKTYSVFDDEEKTYNPYATHGVGLTWEPTIEELEGFRLDFGVDNVFDAHYRTYEGGYDVGQNYKLTLTYTF